MPEAHLPILILIPLFLGVILVPACGLVWPRLSYPVTLVSLVAYATFSLWTLVAVLDAPGQRFSYHLAGWAPPWGIELVVDVLSAFVVSVMASISVIVAVYARLPVRQAMHREGDESGGIGVKEMPFYTVLLIMLVGLSGMVITGDLFNLYVFLEVSSLSAYALMAVGHRKAAVSAYRYLIMGTVGASCYLIGVGYLYFLTGSLNMADVASRASELGTNPAYLLSIVFMVTGLGLKMALFPMHLWLPDAYTYASSTATAIVGPLMTKVSAYVMIRMLFFVYDSELIHDELPIGDALTWLGLAGVTVGSVLAIAQKDAKRMLAYSSVAQVAYIAVGIGLGTPYALIGAMLHILNHAAMKSCLFLVTGNVALRTGTTRLRAFDGLGRSMPWTFFGFTVAALAMVGIPPTNGFFSKWYLVLGGLEAGNFAVVVVVVASGLLTSVYFFRLILRVYAPRRDAGERRDVNDDGKKVREAPLSMVAPVVVLAIALLALGLANSWIVGEVLQHALPDGMDLSGFAPGSR